MGRLLLGSILEAKKTPVWRQGAPSWVHPGSQEVPKRVLMCSFLGFSWKPGRPQYGAKRHPRGSILEARKFPKGCQCALSWVYLGSQEDPKRAPRGSFFGSILEAK